MFTWNDYEIVKDFYDKYDEGIPRGLRSGCLRGKNTSGFALIGGGFRDKAGEFEGLNEDAVWFWPEEYQDDKEIRAHHALISADINDTPPQKYHRELKVRGFSVRCTKLKE